MRNSTLAILAGLPAGCGTNGLYWVDEKLSALSTPPNAYTGLQTPTRTAMRDPQRRTSPRVDSVSPALLPLNSRAEKTDEILSAPSRLQADSSSRKLESEPPTSRLPAISNAEAKPLPSAERRDSSSRVAASEPVRPAVNLDRHSDDRSTQKTPATLVSHERSEEPLLGVNESEPPILPTETTADRSMRPAPEKLLAVETPPAPTPIPTATSMRKPLKVGRIALCRSIEGFGRFTSARSPLRPGDKVLVYAELSGQSPRSIAGRFETRINGKLRLTPKAGGPTTEWAFPNVVDSAPTERADFFVHFLLSLPGSLGEGEYRLEVAVDDVHGAEAACEETSLRVEPAPVSTTGGD